MTLREASKYPFRTADKIATHEEIRTGCMQRMADAAEAMSKNYTELLERVELYRGMLEDQSRMNSQLRTEVRVLRKQIKKETEVQP